MKRLWSKISEKDWRFQKKWRAALALRTFAWVAAALFLCALFGAFVSGFDGNWLKITCAIVGYAGVCGGFFGGILFLMQHTG